MDMLYGKLNKEVELVKYKGIETNTAEVIVNNAQKEISVNVKKVPSRLYIKTDTEEFTFNGSRNIDINLEGYATDDKIDAAIAKEIQDRDNAINTAIEAEKEARENSDIGIINKINDNYAELNNKINKLVIEIPTKTSDLENDSGFITIDSIPTIPTKLSQLENDENFVNETYVTNYVDNILGNIDTQLVELDTGMGV